MLKIVRNEIFLTRGDTVRIGINNFNPSGEPYELREGDTLRFALKRRIADADEDVIIEKDLTGSELLLRPEETEALPFGKYIYDIELEFENGDVDTVIPPTPFYIESEVI